MPLGSKKNVIVGAASVYIAPLGTGKPAKVAATPYRTTVDANVNWRNVGYTQDGFEMSYDPSYGEVEVDQLLDAVLIFKDGQSVSLSTTFAEATLENLLVAWGQASSVPVTTANDKTIIVKGGNLGEAPVERTLLAVGAAPRLTDSATTYQDRALHTYRVLSVESSAFSMARADAATIPVTFRALPDDNGDYGTIVDYLA